VLRAPAGALTDVLTRAVAQRLSEMWKQSVSVENRGGAGYSIAAQSVMRAEHDGCIVRAVCRGGRARGHHQEGQRRRAKDHQRSRIPEKISRTLCGAAGTWRARRLCRIFTRGLGQMGRGHQGGEREDRVSATVPAILRPCCDRPGLVPSKAMRRIVATRRTLPAEAARD